jgi:hypothetical protein
VVVTKEIIDAISCAVGIREVMKVKSFIGQSNAVNLRVFFGKVSTQDEPVFTQNVVDTAHVLGGIFIFTVVEGVSAMVRTKFLIPASSQNMTAFKTGTCIHHR